MLREIVLDTETTGLDPEQGHRLVEVAALELVDHLPTGRTFHSYLNPQRDMPEEAFRVHGLSAAFLRDYPAFAEVVEPAAGVPAGQPAGHPQRRLRHPLPERRAGRAGPRAAAVRPRRRHAAAGAARLPGGRRTAWTRCAAASRSTTSTRTLHGALLDCELLAEVYLHLIGGRQIGLGLERPRQRGARQADRSAWSGRPARYAPSPEELAAHAAFVAKLDDPVWLH